jgi:hypothetical protein
MSITIIEGNTQGLQAPIANSRDSYAAYKQQVIASPTAQGLLASLEKSPKSVGVLLIDENFDSMYIPPFVFSGGAPFDGGIAVVNIKSPMTIKGSEIPLGVSLMHELGHAKQYIEAPVAFERKYKEAMGQKKTDYPSELTRTRAGEKISQLIIENENVALHEAPVCDELGLPFRSRYD